MNRVCNALGVIVSIERPPQPAGMDTHRRIGLGIENGGIAQALDRNGALVDLGSPSGEGFFDDEPQKAG